MNTEKQLRRNINGTFYYCEAIRETKEGAKQSRDAQRRAGFKARIFPLVENKRKKFGVYVSF
jgi:hypothetical protein